MMELGSMVILDGQWRGVLVGRRYGAGDEIEVYDVRLSPAKAIINVAAERVEVIGPTRHDVIGRDLSHNPKRSDLLGEKSGARRMGARSTIIR
jgi:hypothetical protein